MLEITNQLFTQISVVVITAGLLALIARLLRQPIMIALVLAGLVIGPSVFVLTEGAAVLDALASIAIAVLIFLIAINLNWRGVRDLAKIAFVVGMGQMLIVGAAGYFIASQFFDITTSIFLGIAFALSSTVVIVKLLADKRDLHRSYGKLTTAMLLLQAAVVMLLLLIVDGIGVQGFETIGSVLGFAALKALAAVIVLLLLAKYIVPFLFAYAGKSVELLFLTAMSWGFAVVSALMLFGFGMEIAALLAGLSLAGSAAQREIESRVWPLRDLFLILFFIILATRFTSVSFASIIVPALAFSTFILFVKPLLIIFIARAFGYHPRSGFLAGVASVPIGEWSLVLLAAGISIGLVNTNILAVATLVSFITIAISTYLISFNEEIYGVLEPLFAWMERKPSQDVKARKKYDVVLIGFDKVGRAIFPAVNALKKKFVVVDMNPHVITELEDKGIACEYGDAGNERFLDYIDAEYASIVISTIPDMAVNTDILEFFKRRRSKTNFVATAQTQEDAAELYRLGAAFVIVPHLFGGEMFADMLKKKKTSRVAWGAAAKSHKKALGV